MANGFDKHKEYWVKKSGIPCAFLEWLPNPSKLQILDLGCGGGRIASSLITEDNAVYGIDSSVELLERARNACPKLMVFAGDFQNQAVWERIPPLDLIISNCAIRKDYCPQISNIMQFCHAKLKTGGLLLLRVEIVPDLSEVLPKSLRETLFYSNDCLTESLKIFSNVKVKQDSYRQKFSSAEYMKTFLERIQIDVEKINCLNPVRCYSVICAKK